MSIDRPITLINDVIDTATFIIHNIVHFVFSVSLETHQIGIDRKEITEIIFDKLFYKLLWYTKINTES